MKLSMESLISRRALARSIVCGMLLFLTSCCCIPGLRLAEPPPGLPTTYDGSADPDNSAYLGIEDYFNDPTLTHLIDQALVGNRELKILNEEIEVAGAELLRRRGAYLPFITFGAGGGMDTNSLYTPLGAVEKRFEFDPGKRFPDPLPDMRLGLGFFMPLDLWREFRNARDAAGLRYFSAVERRNYFVTRLIADVAENYYKLMALDNRLDNLDLTIKLQQQSLNLAQSRLDAGRGNALSVQRFQAEVRKNQSEKLSVRQDIVETENRINYLLNRYPQPVDRAPERFLQLSTQALRVGLPAQLLHNRPDIRQAERDLEAAGLDIKVARAHFFPRVDITAGVGYEAFSPKYLFNTPEALVYSAMGNLVAPLINKSAIKAEYLTANALQLECVYNYQRVVLNAFTEVVNRLAMVVNYGKSIEVRRQQLEALETAVGTATKLFQNARTEYIEVLLAQRDMMDARMILIETKQQQMSGFVTAYQALGGGDLTRFPEKMKLCVSKGPVAVDLPMPVEKNARSSPETGKEKAPANDKASKDKDKDKAPAKDKNRPDAGPALPAPRLQVLPPLTKP